MKKMLFLLALAVHRTIFRLSRGALGGRIRGVDILILRTTGRRTGKTRAAPLGYFIEDNAYVVAAFAGGAPTHPGWYHNLVARPNAAIELKGGRAISVRAEEAQGDQRDRLWRAFTGLVDGYDGSQQPAARIIPVFVLRPQST